MGRLYPEALLLAQNVVEAITPFCERIEIAGSLRRKKPVVKDIEICAIPKWDERIDPTDLFQGRVLFNLLHEDWAKQSAQFRRIVPPVETDWKDKDAVATWPIEMASVQWIKPATDEIIWWKVEPDGSYWRGLLPGEIKLDLFLTTPEKWGVIFLLRTGSREFNLALIDYGRRHGLRIKNGRLLDNEDNPLRTSEEADVFDHLGLEYVEPTERTGREAIRPKGSAAMSGSL